MNTWVTRMREAGRLGSLPRQFYDTDFLKDLQQCVEHAESLRPSAILNCRDNQPLIFAENRVIISEKNPDNNALATVVAALEATGLNSDRSRKMVDVWSRARAKIPETKQRALN